MDTENLKVAVLRGPNGRGADKDLLAMVIIEVHPARGIRHSGIFMKLARNLLNSYASSVLIEPLTEPTANWIEEIYYGSQKGGFSIEVLDIGDKTDAK